MRETVSPFGETKEKESMRTTGCFISTKWALFIGILGIGALAHGLKAGVEPNSPADVPAAARPAHRFLPIRPEWRKGVRYLQTDRAVEHGGAFIVTQEEVGLDGIKKCSREELYYAGEETYPRKMVQFHPSGYVEDESDLVGEECFSRALYPNGSIRSYRYERERRLLQAYDFSPDGRMSVWIRDGAGERESRDHGRSGFRVHRWFHRGRQLLEKRYKGRELVSIRLDTDAAGDDWDMLVVEPYSESLHVGDRMWYHTPYDHRVTFQSKDHPLNMSGWEDPERDREAARFPVCRKEFLERYEKRLKDAGHSWGELGIDFIRAGNSWPK